MRAVECCGSCRGGVLTQLRGISTAAPAAAASSPAAISLPSAFPCRRSLKFFTRTSRRVRSPSSSTLVSAAANTVTETDGLKVWPRSLFYSLFSILSFSQPPLISATLLLYFRFCFCFSTKYFICTLSNAGRVCSYKAVRRAEDRDKWTPEEGQLK